MTPDHQRITELEQVRLAQEALWLIERAQHALTKAGSCWDMAGAHMADAELDRMLGSEWSPRAPHPITTMCNELGRLLHEHERTVRGMLDDAANRGLSMP